MDTKQQPLTLALIPCLNHTCILEMHFPLINVSTLKQVYYILLTLSNVILEAFICVFHVFACLQCNFFCASPLAHFFLVQEF